MQPDTQVNEITTNPYAVVKPRIELDINFERGGIFLPDRGEIPMVTPLNILRAAGYYCSTG